MPGVEFHANVIDNLLRADALRQAGMRWTYASGFYFLDCSADFLSRDVPRGWAR